MQTDVTAKRYVLRIYTTAKNAESQALAAKFKDVLDAHLSVEIVDVLEHPDRAVADGIFATPTVIKELPEPVSRLLGDIRDPSRILLLLGLVDEGPQA